ncbi:MAG: acyl-CoA thioesterase [endosymbiont of Galathealinum brachiosum]|uniref:Acyl-CoA thioesterase n=1 Tax=endosymbiont of Galathealinum brachiosum TaxID=2200906 RepID=A0A370DDH1_9GAMM|nr:MAG: acyl-CoA thioesterase [endosymbiont of Galathealinum brachiosum]
MPQDVLPENKIPVIRVPAMPSDLNQGGTVFGGWIMSQVDIAGSIPAAERAGGSIVTRAVDSFEFKKPVFAGDLLSCYAEVVKVGRTSITVHVEVYAQHMVKGVVTTMAVTEASLVYVAIDERGKPRAVPKV